MWESEHPFTIPELFEGIRSAIWSELESGDRINSFRRNLQRVHLNKIISLVVKPPKGVPPDASSLARSDLIQLRDAISKNNASPAFDKSTRAHFDEAAARIKAALVAAIERQM